MRKGGERKGSILSSSTASRARCRLQDNSHRPAATCQHDRVSQPLSRDRAEPREGALGRKRRKTGPKLHPDTSKAHPRRQDPAGWEHPQPEPEEHPAHGESIRLRSLQRDLELSSLPSCSFPASLC